jgi:hypothetical protein
MRGLQTFIVENVSQHPGDVIVLSGVAEGIKESYFHLALEGDSVLGKIGIHNALFVIEPEPGSERHTVAFIDSALFPRAEDLLNHDHPRDRDAESRQAFDRPFAVNRTSGSGAVRILFLVANNVPNPNGLSALIVSEFNGALVRSGVSANNKLVSAGVRVVPDSFNGSTDCRGSILWDMVREAFPFSNLDQIMDDTSADMALTIFRTGSLYTPCPDPEHDSIPAILAAASGQFGGVATLPYPGLFDFTTADNAFANTSDTYALGDLTAIHEIGHVLGGLHANTVKLPDAAFPLSEYAHGMEGNNAGSWQTIMGGYTTNRCNFDWQVDPNQQPCDRIPYFSNPSKQVLVNSQWVTIGTLVDTPTNDADLTQLDPDAQFKADMVSFLDVTGMPLVSGYRPDPMPPASAPNLDAVSLWCFGQHKVDWNAVSGANRYELYRSNSSSFSSPVRVFEGTATSTFLNIGPFPSTQFLRVKACNAGGCSGYSNQRTVNYIDGCF